MIFRNINHYACSVFAIFLVICCSQGFAKESFISREQALAAMFPDSQIHSRTVFLTKAQIEEAQNLSGEEINSALIARYEIVKDGRLIARAYVDTHAVRTKKESLLIILDPDGKVLRLEVTASKEPPEYRATPEWYQQYHGKSLDDDLYVDRAIRPMAGATLTVRAANQAVRRIMAIDRALERK
jgi:Na+-translocating ferredoxin:NAD+ oxidoreductase RnfG subunit